MDGTPAERRCKRPLLNRVRDPLRNIFFTSGPITSSTNALILRPRRSKPERIQTDIFTCWLCNGTAARLSVSDRLNPLVQQVCRKEDRNSGVDDTTLETGENSGRWRVSKALVRAIKVTISCSRSRREKVKERAQSARGSSELVREALEESAEINSPRDIAVRQHAANSTRILNNGY